MMRKLAGGWAGLALLVFAAACFSDRSGATGPSGASCNANLDPTQFGSVIVAIRGFAFAPAAVHVKAGNKVTWLDCEPAGTESHTTTSDGGVWRSALLATGDTYTFLFPTAGTFAYHCEIHPSMTGQVVVDP